MNSVPVALFSALLAGSHPSHDAVAPEKFVLPPGSTEPLSISAPPPRIKAPVSTAPSDATELP